MNVAISRDDCDVAVIGAGPYGLAVAAHLRAAKIATRVFGQPVASWRRQMPQGMKLLSPWSASHIPDPQKRFTLDLFARQHGFGPVAERLPLDRYVAYGEWFQRQAVPDADPRNVIRVEDTGRGFCLVLEDGEPIRAQRVVVATGLAQQEFRPRAFAGLPPELVSHTYEHARLDRWRGARVAVVGRGQGACESAALLREAGTDVELICRGAIRWLDGTETSPLNWLKEAPTVLHGAPDAIRRWINARSLRPAAAAWLQPRLADVRVRAGGAVQNAAIKGNHVCVTLDGEPQVYDHVLLATGYKPDIAKLRMLPRELLQRVAQIDGSPVLGAGFVSTVPGLYFVGASAARSFGPSMRVIAGAGYAARAVTNAVIEQHVQRRASLWPMAPDLLTDGGLLHR
jgi:cation diffusion facilitator CzcD-associated flavoprotein CzcO